MPIENPALAQLKHVALGVPITRLGVSLFPLYSTTRSNRVDSPVTIASSAEGLAITEQGSAVVPGITVTNPLDRPVLLVEGETITGGQQNRVLNVSVLVPAGSSLTVPVSCVEAGRWGGDSQFSRGRTFATRRVRRVKVASVGENLSVGETRFSDQGAVWNTIDLELDRLKVDSTTRAMHSVEALLDAPSEVASHERLAEVVDELVRRGPLPGQCGVVIGHGSRIVSFELFGDAELLEANWSALVRAALLDAPTHVTGRPSIDRALRFVHRLTRARSFDTEGVGLGREVHLRSPRLVGQMLTLDDAVVHASAFALAA